MAKTTQELSFEARQLVYNNAAELHRYFLTWRHQLLAGYLAVIAALSLAFSWAHSQPQNCRPWIAIVAFFAVILTAFFWVLEFRNRQLYRGCQNVAQNIEREFGLVPKQAATLSCGVYDELIRTTKPILNHSVIMNLFFAIALFSVVAVSLLSIFVLD